MFTRSSLGVVIAEAAGMTLQQQAEFATELNNYWLNKQVQLEDQSQEAMLYDREVSEIAKKVKN